MDAALQAIAATRRDITDRLKQVLIQSLNLDMRPEEIAEDAPLFGMGLGLDSIDALQLVIGIEERFALSIPSDEVAVFRSINTLADYILARSAAS